MQSPAHKDPVVLLVEDDRDMRWLLRKVLVQEDCSVITRATGKMELLGRIREALGHGERTL